jgi:hypothetical protein
MAIIKCIIFLTNQIITESRAEARDVSLVYYIIIEFLSLTLFSMTAVDKRGEREGERLLKPYLR